ncbi:MAG: NAD(P)H-dependent oxidoreductase subunit E [Bacteroidetes bacterium]|jgi:NADH-quinone oxidoreductase subunit E|nr:NAD(P)H-dependent oxidoreductase subunit E [Bacteroidota bacterium]
MRPESIMPIIEKHKGHRGELISILEEIQSKEGYLPKDDLQLVAAHTGRNLVDIYGVATFYKAFRLSPRGKHLASVCLGTACHVRGGPAVAEEFEKQLGVKPGGGTTTDKEFTLETVRCLGACALGPIVVMDGHYFSNVNTTQVAEIIARTKSGLDAVSGAGDRRVFPLEVSCPKCNHSLMDQAHLVDGVPAIRMTVSFGHEHGWLRLSSLYGSYTVESGNEIPMGAIVNFFCPHCHAELIGAWNCTACDAPMVPMIVQGGGIVQICSRRGCTSHMLDLEADQSL